MLAAEPEHPVAWNGIGLVLSELKKFEDARNAFARAMQARPNYAEAHYNLSFALSNLGDFEGALRETKRALELDPYYVAQKFELAIDLEYEDPDLSIQPDLGEERRIDAAVEDFAFDARVLDSLFTDLAPTPRTPPMAVPASSEADPYAMATDFLSKGLFDRAQAEVKRAIARGGDKVRGNTLLGDVVHEAGVVRGGTRAIPGGSPRRPDHPAAMIGEASALLRLGRATRRVRSPKRYCSAGRRRSTRSCSPRRRAREAGDPAAALAALETGAAPRAHARRRPPAHRRHRARRSATTTARSRRIATRWRSTRTSPSCASSSRGCCAERRQIARRSRSSQAALDAVPTYAEATLELWRDCCGTCAAPARRCDCWSSCSSATRTTSTRCSRWAKTLLALERKARRGHRVPRVLRFDPNHVGALYYDGVLLAEQHRYREAIERWQKVIELDPTRDYARRARREIRTAGDLQRDLRRHGRRADHGDRRHRSASSASTTSSSCST